MNLNIELLYLNVKHKQQIKNSILDKLEDTVLLVGMGNIYGLGYFIIKEFSKAS